MLAIRVELWPGGDRDRATEIGRCYIWNETGAGEAKRANYGVAIMPDGKLDVLAYRELMLKHAAVHASVEDYPRGPRNLWPLIRDALVACRLRKAASRPFSHGDRRPELGKLHPRIRGK